jgi:multidrug efflux pump subunit AcrA (membrane-fusion protein)
LPPADIESLTLVLRRLTSLDELFRLQQPAARGAAEDHKAKMSEINKRLHLELEDLKATQRQIEAQIEQLRRAREAETDAERQRDLDRLILKVTVERERVLREYESLRRQLESQDSTRPPAPPDKQAPGSSAGWASYPTLAEAVAVGGPGPGGRKGLADSEPRTPYFIVTAFRETALDKLRTQLRAKGQERQAQRQNLLHEQRRRLTVRGDPLPGSDHVCPRFGRGDPSRLGARSAGQGRRPAGPGVGPGDQETPCRRWCQAR